MKANHPYVWEITLTGRKAVEGRYFEGTLDEALHEADVMECGVRFVVIKFTLARLERVKVKKAKAA